MRGHLVTLLAGLFVAACRSNSYTPPHPPPGSDCYRLLFSSWSPEVRRADMDWFMPPDVVALTRQPIQQPALPGSFRVLPDVDPALPGPQKIAFAEWRTAQNGSVEVLWGNGFTGVRLVLHRTGDNLEGSAATFSDAPGGVYNASVRGTSVSCEQASASMGVSTKRAAQK